MRFWIGLPGPFGVGFGGRGPKRKISRRYYIFCLLFGIFMAFLLLILSVATHQPEAGAATPKVSFDNRVTQIIVQGNNTVQRDKLIVNDTKAFKYISVAFAESADQLGELTFPKNARSDAKSMIRILNKLSSDASRLSKLSKTTDFVEIEKLGQTVQKDESTQLADANALFGSLGIQTPATNNAIN